MNKKIVLAVTGLLAPLLLFGSEPKTPNLTFEEKDADFSLFKETSVDVASYSYDYMDYNIWKTSASGKFFPMEVAPVFHGMVEGDVKLPDPVPVDPTKYEGQAAEFADVVNARNLGGRAEVEKSDSDAKTLLDKLEGSTTVVEVRLSTLIDKKFETMTLTPENVATMAEVVDVDHYHFQIPGSFVEQALEKNHIAYKNLDLQRNYLLSVFDLRDYGCAVMKDGIRDQFAKNPEKDRLSNESIYVISDVQLNAPEAVAAASEYFHKKPAAVITQESIYADHLVRGAKTIFAFYPEGEKTRIVLISNIAMGSRFFKGVQGAVIRQYLLFGVGGYTLKAKESVDALTNLLSGATADMGQKNSCDRGLALGLIKYSQGLFQKFVNFTVE